MSAPASTKIEAPEVLVIGGGISGLSFAYRMAGAGLDTLVIEGSGRLGGCINSARFAGSEGDPYWLELGAHTCYNSYGGLLEMVDACGLTDALLPRDKVPFRLIIDGEIRSVGKELSKLELLLSLPRLIGAKKGESTVAEYYGRIVGRKNFERVLSPLLAAVPSQNADGFPATMLFKKRPRRKDVLRSYTMKDGLSAIVDALASRDGIRTLKGVEAKSVRRDGSGFAVELSDGRSIAAPIVAVATPPPAAAALLEGERPELADPLHSIASVRVDSLGVVLPAAATELEPVAGIVPRSDEFFSVVSRDTVPHPSLRGFTFHFRPGLDAETRLATVERVLGAPRDAIVHTAEATVTLPAPVRGHEKLAAAISKGLAGGKLAITGSYFAGLAIEDCIGRSFAEAARVSGR